MTRLSILVLLIAVVAAFALSAGCTFNIPGAPNVTPGVTVARTATPIATGTVIATATRTATVTATRTGTTIQTVTPTYTATATHTVTPVVTVTSTPTGTAAGPGTVSGVKWNDLNGDHKRDAGEPVLAGWTIILTMQEQNGSNWFEIARAVTDANGAYSFVGLAEGHYRVYEVAQTGWTRTYPTNAEGMHNLVISNGQPSWTGQDFGNTGGTTTTTVTPTVTTTGTVTVTSTVTPSPTVSPSPIVSVTSTVTGTGTTTGTVVTATTPGTSGSTALTGLALTANNIAFDKTTLSAPAGSVVGLVFLNNDAGVPHNFALYTDATATTPIFKGAIVTGQVTTTYTFTAPSTPGTYFFRCDVHPTQMTGTFIVT